MRDTTIIQDVENYIQQGVEVTTFLFYDKPSRSVILATVDSLSIANDEYGVDMNYTSLLWEKILEKTRELNYIVLEVKSDRDYKLSPQVESLLLSRSVRRVIFTSVEHFLSTFIEEELTGPEEMLQSMINLLKLQKLDKDFRKELSNI